MDSSGERRPSGRRAAALDHAQRFARACKDAHDALAFGPDVGIESVGPRALDAFDRTWRRASRRVAWPWDRWVPDMRRRHPACFTMALWHEDALCALAIGFAERGKHVTITAVEGHPDPDEPLKGWAIPATLTVAEFYRIQLQAPELRLRDVADGLVPLYQGFGFALAPDPGGTHHMRRRG